MLAREIARSTPLDGLTPKALAILSAYKGRLDPQLVAQAAAVENAGEQLLDAAEDDSGGKVQPAPRSARSRQGRSKGRGSRNRGVGSARRERVRTGKRYDPLSWPPRSYKIRSDDPRYDTWPSRKPSRAAYEKARYGVSEKEVRSGAKFVQDVGAGLAPIIGGLAASGKLAKVGAAARTAAFAGGTALAAGIAAFILTDALLNMGESRDDVRFNVSQAYRRARQQLAQQLGRAPSPAELAPITARYRELVARLGAYPIESPFRRAGAE